MNDIIKSLLELLKGLGLTNESIRWAILLLSLLSVLVTVGSLLWKILAKIFSVRNQKLLNEDLKPFFTREDVQRATKYFIPTMGQNVSPSEDDEPGRMYITAAKNKLIPLFLKKVFSNRAQSTKYYMVLADTGMGKTTFLINLLLRYKNQWKYILNLSKPQNIVLYPLGDPRVLGIIAELPDKKDTILLLDAFDEDIAALDAHEKRMIEILDKTQDFRMIVITCRTQFFPSEEEEPHKTGYFSFGGSGEYKFEKLYLSVFDDSDVKKYLRRRFSLLSIPSYFKAKAIVRKCPNLVVRPMLLSHIKDLIGSDSPFDYSFQIYEVMIRKWIEREAEKPGTVQKYGDSKEYQKLLYQFSRALAVNLYENKEKRGGYLISKDEKIALHSHIQIADIEDEYLQLALTEKEARTQSLLNRNSKGQYKFSHKSFLEYFLAQELLDNGEFYRSFDFSGMSAAKSFFHEMLASKLSKRDGWYSTSGTVLMRPMSYLKTDELTQVYSMQAFDLDDSDLINISECKGLSRLTLRNDGKFAYLYEIYVYILWFGFSMWDQIQPPEVPSWVVSMKPLDAAAWIGEFRAIANSLDAVGLGGLFDHLSVNPEQVIERLKMLAGLRIRFSFTSKTSTLEYSSGMTVVRYDGDLATISTHLRQALQPCLDLRDNEASYGRAMEGRFGSPLGPKTGVIDRLCSVRHKESREINTYFTKVLELQSQLPKCIIYF